MKRAYITLLLTILLFIFSCTDANYTGRSSAGLYNEAYRPQFHFTAKKNWLNDSNGLVFYKGKYHLFFQHNPTGINWGNMHWGHAVSKDLVHWKEKSLALYPDELGMQFSGSAVVDWENTAGFQTGKEKTLVAIYTAHDGDNNHLETQCLAFSTDAGQTWQKYKDNPVIDCKYPGKQRDPKVFCYWPEKKWVMCLFENGGIAFYSSHDLKDWNWLSRVEGYHECPDMFELEVDADESNKKWVLLGGDGNYHLGYFDGYKFVPETKQKLRGDWGKNFYATQTYSDIPESDGRRIQITWMRGGRYPSMPFNQQMTFPCQLTLKTFSEGTRLCKVPVREIENIHLKKHSWKNRTLKPGQNLLKGITGEVFDIRAEIELIDAQAFSFELRSNKVEYDVRTRELSSLGAKAPLELISNRLKLQILLDRTSIEVYADQGRVSMSSCFVPDLQDKSLNLYTRGGRVKVISLQVYELKSIWR